jgi:hypothetical protein
MQISTIISNITSVVTKVSSNIPMNVKKYIAIGLVGVIVIGIVNPFGILDSAETAKIKKIIANNAELTALMEEKIIDRDNTDKSITSLNTENSNNSTKIVSINQEICGLVKQLGNETYENNKICNPEEMKVFVMPENYDVVAAYVEKYMGKKSMFNMVEANVSSETNSEKTKEQKITPITAINTGTLLPGDKIVNGIVEHKYTSTDSLFYGTHVFDKCYVSQNEKDHFKNNGRMATDIACNHKPVFIYAPDYKNEAVKYTVKVVKNWDTGDSIELYFKSPEDGVEYYWLFGHTATTLKDGATVKTGEVIGLMNLSGITEGYHLHQELWQGTNAVSYKITNKVLTMRAEKK